ncbi:MAG: putative selenate ABC transporter substrate-binding protein [Planctomycetota bacterium]
MRFLTLTTLLLCAACGSKDTGAQSDSTEGSSASSEALVFSAIPDDNKTELRQRYNLIADHLSKELGIPVLYNPSANYDTSVAAFKAGDIQLAWFGGVSGVQARVAVPGAVAIAQGVVDPQYKSYFIANAAAGITPGDTFPMALAGQPFTFGDAMSTSGRVMPEFYIRKETGKSPEEFFGHPNKFSGSHDLTAEQVQDGTVMAGALNYKTYDRLVADGKIDPAKAILVWTTPTYPDYNWTAHPVLEERYGKGFTAKLQKALVGIQDPALLKALDRPEGLIEASNADFEPVAETMKNMGMLR